MENKIPHWDMDSIYPGFESDEYKAALKDMDNSLSNLEALLETADQFTRENNANFDFAAWLEQFFVEYNKASSFLGTLGAFAYGKYATDTTNTDALNNLNTVDEISTRMNQIFIKFGTQIVAHQKYLDDFYARFPKYEEYRYVINEIIEDKKHQMSASEEKLASELNRTGGDAWGRLQETLISNLADENGKTFNELRNDANSADPKLRRESWAKEVSLLTQNKIAFAACLNNLKGQTITLNKKRNYAEAIERSLGRSRLSRETLDALIGAIEDSLPMWRSYFQAKAKLLRKAGATVSKSAGTDEHKGIAFYDLFAPVENPDKNAAVDANSLFNKTWSFEEASEYILKEYNSFSKYMGDFAKKAFDNNWIDAEVRAGKVGGAFDNDFPKGHQSRILSNFTGAFSDIITLAHELGHAYHFSCMKDKDPIFFDYPMTLAETASTFAETIVKQDMLKQAEGFDRIRIMDLDLTDASQVLVDILSRFYFERSVFEERLNGELTSADFCRLMQKAQDMSYGNGLNDERNSDDTNFTERHDYMWAVKGHYYSTGLDFYNFPYAFGLLFAAGLYVRSLNEGPSFADTYPEILSNTGSMSCEALCAKAGFDITTKDFWKSGIDMYAKEVAEYVKYVDSL